MNYLNIILLAVVLAVYQGAFAAGSDNSCFNETRAALANNRMAVPAEVNSSVGRPLAQMLLNEQKYSKHLKSEGDSDIGTVTATSYEYNLYLGDMRVEVSEEIETVDESSSMLFSLARQWTISRGGVPQKKLDYTWTFDNQCQKTLVLKKNRTYEKRANGQFVVLNRVEERGQPDVVSQIVVSEQVIKDSQLSSEEILNSRARIGEQLEVLTEDNEKKITKTLVHLDKAPARSGFDRGIEIKFLVAEISANIYRSLSNQRIESAFRVGKIVLKDKEISREEFLSLDFMSTSQIGSDLEVAGLTKDDFEGNSLKYRVSGKGKLPKFLNIDRYGAISNVFVQNGTWSFDVTDISNTATPPSFHWNTPVDVTDRAFIKGTHYIQPDKVDVLATSVRAKLTTGSTRLDAAGEIARVVSNYLEFDYEQVADDRVTRRQTEAIMKIRKGVCQHYAAVYVSVARALGIPARIVSGILLDADGAGAHAWVEVKIDSTRWWPIEPQDDKALLARRGYLPLSVDWIYESSSGSLTDVLARSTDFAEIPKITKIEKIGN